MGIWPDTNMKPLDFTATEYGPTGVGALLGFRVSTFTASSTKVFSPDKLKIFYTCLVFSQGGNEGVRKKSLFSNRYNSGRAIVQEIEHNIEEERVNPSRSHSSHSLFSSFASTKRPTRRFSLLLQLRSQPHPCGFEVVLYGCSLGAREAV